MSSNLVPYRKYTPEENDADAQFAESQDVGGSGFFKPKQGKNVIRVLPPAHDYEKPMPNGQKPGRILTVMGHFLESPTGDTLSFACPKVHGNPKRACDSCTHGMKLRENGNDRDYDIGYGFLPKRNHYLDIIDRANPVAGPIVWRFGKTVFEDLKVILATRGDYMDPTDDGFDLVVFKSGEKKQTKYKLGAFPQSSPLGTPDEVEEWMDARRNLLRFAMAWSPDKMAEKLSDFLGTGGGGPKPSRSVGDDITFVER